MYVCVFRPHEVLVTGRILGCELRMVQLSQFFLSFLYDVPSAVGLGLSMYKNFAR